LQWTTIGPVKVRYHSSPYWWGEWKGVTTFEFPSLYAAVKWARPRARELEHGHLPQRFKNEYGDWILSKGDAYVFLDECDLVIPAWRVLEERAKVPPIPSARKRIVNTEFRREPVPHTGKRRYRNYHYHRYVKTIQEIRENDFFEYDNEDGITIRGKRKRSNMRTVWDDIQRLSAHDKCWKRYRSKRWKPKK
jgi:hypothetical protein